MIRKEILLAGGLAGIVMAAAGLAVLIHKHLASR